METEEVLNAIKKRGLVVKRVIERLEIPETEFVLEDGYFALIYRVSEVSYWNYDNESFDPHERFCMVRCADNPAVRTVTHPLGGPLDDFLVFMIQEMKKDIKRMAKSLFNLPYSTPARILSDRYEEEGMEAEARILRLDSTVKRIYNHDNLAPLDDSLMEIE